MRPEWMWVALRGDHLVARIAWWTGQDGGTPQFLDFFDLDDTLPEPERGEIGLKLLETATASVVPAGTVPPEYGRYIPPDWREDPAARDVVEARIRVMEASGARMLVERLRLEWRAGTPVPEDTGRLVFRQVSGREDLLTLMTPVMAGTLDAHGQADLASGLSAREAAEKQYDEEFAGLRTPQEWWRIAELPDGEPVGFVIPARNNYHPMIAYIGVLAGAPRTRIHRRHPGRGHPGARRAGRGAHQGEHRRRERPDGEVVRAPGLRQLRALLRHGVGLTQNGWTTGLGFRTVGAEPRSRMRKEASRMRTASFPRSRPVRRAVSDSV